MSLVSIVCLLLSSGEALQEGTPASGPQLPKLAAGPGSTGPTVSTLGAGQQADLFDFLDKNDDGVVTRDEVPQSFRSSVEPYFRRSGKTALTPADFARPQRRGPVTVFSLLDADKDGKVTQQEIEDARNNPMRLQLTGAQTRPIFEALTASGRKDFTRQQFDEAMSGFRKSIQNAKLKQAFEELDTNKDGTISVEEAPRELKPVLEQLLSTAKMPLGSKLNFEELERVVAASRLAPAPAEPKVPAAFQLLDLNRDGFIQPTELAELSDIIARLASLDVNADDKLSVEEFIGPDKPSAPPSPRPGIPINREPVEEPQPTPQADPIDKFVADFFRKFDADKNGKLTAAEIPDKASAKIGRLDFDGDGAISRSELKEGLMQR